MSQIYFANLAIYLIWPLYLRAVGQTSSPPTMPNDVEASRLIAAYYTVIFSSTQFQSRRFSARLLSRLESATISVYQTELRAISRFIVDLSSHPPLELLIQTLNSVIIGSPSPITRSGKQSPSASAIVRTIRRINEHWCTYLTNTVINTASYNSIIRNRINTFHVNEFSLPDPLSAVKQRHPELESLLDSFNVMIPHLIESSDSLFLFGCFDSRFLMQISPIIEIPVFICLLPRCFFTLANTQLIKDHLSQLSDFSGQHFEFSNITDQLNTLTLTDERRSVKSRDSISNLLLASATAKKATSQPSLASAPSDWPSLPSTSDVSTSQPKKSLTLPKSLRGNSTRSSRPSQISKSRQLLASPAASTQLSATPKPPKTSKSKRRSRMIFPSTQRNVLQPTLSILNSKMSHLFSNENEGINFARIHNYHERMVTSDLKIRVISNSNVRLSDHIIAVNSLHRSARFIVTVNYATMQLVFTKINDRKRNRYV